MSETSIQLHPIPLPDAVAKTTLRRSSWVRPTSTRGSSFQLDRELDDVTSLHSLRPTMSTAANSIAITDTSRTAAIIASVTLITAISTLLNGVTTVALPTIAKELHMPESIQLWPSSIQALTTGCTLLFSGTIADALGSRFMYLTGTVLQAGFILGCGLAQTSTQLILFRGLSGVAISLCLPSAVAIITSSFVGKRRDMAFAAMGGGQPVGFSVGLALGGVLTDTIGWRWAFYIAAILNIAVLGIAVWGLPKEIDDRSAEGPESSTWRHKLDRLRTEIDWIGAGLASASLALLSYAFAAITGSTSDIRQPSTIASLAISIALIPAFILWVGRQERLGKPAIIPNSLWRNRTFTVICIAVFFTWGSFNALETILTFYFQKAQRVSATRTSLYFLPAPVSGTVSNVAMGLIVHKYKANYLVLGGTALSVVGPLVLVGASAHSNYWETGFLANIFNPIGADSLFTIANLLITSVFPAKTQALAGGVFNTVSQIGKAVGLALVAVIASTVTVESKFADKASPEALMDGYRATWWYSFACICLTFLICVWGLRGIGKVGHKRD
ncbi:hypothetical protein LTR53_008542 [Teratosphaeriaceae sp. CCFEE 6253]|nr:hypothetical protein LTR53_008542 [Teratosphaeriaceae sp. CCFEE 6253]